MWVFTIDKVHAVHAATQRFNGAVCFGDHALADGTVLDEIRDFVAATFQQRGLVPPTETQMCSQPLLV